MKRIIPVLKWFLLVWGGISFVGAAVIGAFFIYKLGPGNVDKVDSATAKDVRFVLNWSNLGDERIEKVIHSYISARSLTGDHLDAYAILIRVCI